LKIRLGSLLIGAGLMGLGWGWGAAQPDQAIVGDLVQLAGVLALTWRLLATAGRGFLAGDPATYTEQFVALAVLAALVMGDPRTAGLVPLLMEAGHMLEERSVMGAREAIDGLRRLHARTATLLVGEEERVIPAQQLRVGDRAVVRSAETIPADAVVTAGRSSIDQSPVTGESMYEEVGPGSTVFAGSVNIDGVLFLEVRGTGSDTVLGRVAALLDEARKTKAPVTRLLERYARIYLPVVLSVAAIVLFATGEVSRAITVLVVACPCALVLSGPAAMVAALAVASRWGVLVKGTSFLERLTEVDTLVLDKTGTVTLGTLSVLSLHPESGVPAETLLCTAACCGYGSQHPVSRAVVAAARERGIDFESPDETREHVGMGLEARVDGQTLLLGRPSWMRERGLDLPSEPRHRHMQVWAAVEGRVLGSIGLADQPRLEARDTLENMSSRGVHRMVLLTGDRRPVAMAVAEELGIEEVEAEVLPERKAEFVTEEQRAGRCVMMVGDGVNDALALHQADVGIAVGAVMNEVALGGADIALMGSSLERLPQLVDLARHTRATVNVNVAVGVGFSVLMLMLAATGVISPLLGALLHNGGAIFVVLNSARLLRLTRVEGASADGAAGGERR
jgi:Cd2+/Zn2+-exporting ATPase